MGNEKSYQNINYFFLFFSFLIKTLTNALRALVSMTLNKIPVIFYIECQQIVSPHCHIYVCVWKVLMMFEINVVPLKFLENLQENMTKISKFTPV